MLLRFIKKFIGCFKSEDVVFQYLDLSRTYSIEEKLFGEGVEKYKSAGVEKLLKLSSPTFCESIFFTFSISSLSKLASS